MTLPSREKVQGIARPQLQRALAEQGRPVVIRRSGTADVEVMALLVPVTPEGRRQVEVTRPQMTVTNWKVFFAHDVTAVREAGFTVLAPMAQGQPMVELTPVSPTVDVMDQGVVLMVICSPLAERTRTALLMFRLAGAQPVVDPVTGNVRPAPAGQLSVPVRLVATSDPRIREMAGADDASVALVGRWGSLEGPLPRPAGVSWGSTSPFVLDGQRGVLTVQVAYPDSDLAQEAQFGQRFVALWRAGP